MPGEASKRISVALAIQDQLLQQIIERGFRDAEGVVVVGSVTQDDLKHGLQSLTTDVVVMQLERYRSPESDETCRLIVEKNPNVSIIALENHGRTATLFELTPTLMCLGEATTDRIVEFVRGWHSKGLTKHEGLMTNAAGLQPNRERASIWAAHVVRCKKCAHGAHTLRTKVLIQISE